MVVVAEEGVEVCTDSGLVAGVGSIFSLEQPLHNITSIVDKIMNTIGFLISTYLSMIICNCREPS